MKRYKTPGLPTWPALYWDEKRGKAIVEGKTKSWRSRLKGDGVMGILLMLALVLLAPIAWNLAKYRVPQFAILWLGGAFLLFLLTMIFSPLMHRFVFTPKKRITMTSKKIWIGRKSYPREHLGVPLSFNFQIGPDPEAERRIAVKKMGDKYRHMHSIARRVNMVISTSQADALSSSTQQIGPGNLVQVAEVLGDEAASDFVLVCIAAFTLSAVDPKSTTAAPLGHDLDGPI